MSPVQISHFSDVLCVWAYVGQSNLKTLVSTFKAQIDIDVRFCSVFPDTQTKIESLWKDRGGFDGYARHVQDIAGKFDGMPVHEDTWSIARPKSSASAHLFVKAVELLEPKTPTPYSDRLSVLAAQELRSAFFARAEDVGHWRVQRQIAHQIGIDFDDVIGKIETGEAIARLAADYDLGQSLKIEGSPTYVLNDGRQKLFGNVSYGIIEANVTELLSDQSGEAASLCT